MRRAVPGSYFQMPTKLEKDLKREIEVAGKPYIVTVDPTGLKLVEKRKRKGIELQWKDLLNGEAALAAVLNASFRDGH